MKERPDPFRTLDDPDPPFVVTDEMARNVGHAAWQFARASGCSMLRIAPDIVLTTSGAPPNAWYRFWARALLGWKWERL